MPVSEYVRAIGIQHSVNVYIPDTTALITSNLVNEPVKSVFLFICKQFRYSIQVTGSILEFIPYRPVNPVVPNQGPKPLLISYTDGKLEVDLQDDSLARVIRRISQLTGKKLLTRPGVEGTLTAFLPPTSLDTALEAIFVANGYRLKPRRKGYLLVEPTTYAPPQNANGASVRPGAPSQVGSQGRLDFVVESYTDGKDAYLTIEAEGADLQALVQSIFTQAQVDYLIYENLLGTITLNASIAKIDDALRYILQGTSYTFRREGDLFLIGNKDLDGLQTIDIVKLKYRPTFQAMELIPGADVSYNTAGQTNNQANSRPLNTQQGQNRPFNNGQQTGFNNNSLNGFNNGFNSGFSIGGGGGFMAASQPPEIVQATVGQVELIDYPELNQIILKGPADEVATLKALLTEIDKPVPMVKVEMIVVEINKDRLLNTGLRAGRRGANDTANVVKQVLPGLNYTLDGGEINRLLGSVPALTNLGVLRTDVYVQLQAQEVRGNLKVNMRPVLSMLNGREASLTIGQTQYYLLETTTSNNGAVNSFQQFTQRFERIDANTTLTLKPYISDDGMVTLDVFPDFTSPVGQLTADVPPTIATRRFASTIRVRSGETVILGGLSEEATGENTSGLPWVSRVPVLKWIFGNVRKQREESSLLIYLTPVVYYN